ncbi:MAG: hypothetical protein AAB035_04615 [Nitrospirota bacterium]
MMVSRNTHLKIAAGIWGMVGFGLLMAGLFFLFGNRSVSTLPGATTAIGLPEGIGFIIALIIGFVKGQIVLPKVAKKNIARIMTLPEKSPIFTTFSVRSWTLVLGMILLGRFIRVMGAPHFVVGTIYMAVGIALLLGSRVYLKEQA